MNKFTIVVQLERHESLKLEVFSETSNEDLYLIDEADARENGETPYQILEGHAYEYWLHKDYVIEEIRGVVSRSKRNPNQGRITPGIYVGTLSLAVLERESGNKVAEVKLEVRSIKANYRIDYRLMLEEITEKCTDLLLQPNSPISQYFTVNYEAEPRTLYQRFAFIKSILQSSEFDNAVHQFLQSPINTWEETEIEKDIRGLKKINSRSLKQLLSTGNRINLPSQHSLYLQLSSIPSKVKTFHKKESIDTPENQFIRYVLTTFLFFCTDVRSKANHARLAQEALLLEEQLERYLSHSLFSDISFPQLLPLNSPVLQKKEGYREIFRAWLMFDLAAKLIWHGGDDVYAGNKKDVAVLYEYWLFFKLLDVIKGVFKIESEQLSSLIEQTKDGLGLRLKQGQYLPIKGICKVDTRTLNVEFSYNRTFSGDNSYPNGGSWTKNMRPDYTLSIWPFGIDAIEAEEQELMVHIHFDAKYRVENLKNIFGSNESLEEEKEGEEKGTYKRADLLKMHAYKDAIRRTAGAYILYPGSEFKRISGFHELLPGLGAFAINPGNADEGTAHLKRFLYEVVEHFINRATQREKMAYKTYEVHKVKNSNQLKESLPEMIRENRNFLPDEIFVLIAYYKNEDHLEWILQNKLYNARMGTTSGSLRLGLNQVKSSYLLLHSLGELQTNKLFKLYSTGPRIFSKEDMLRRKYPNPTNNFYLVFDILGDPENEFANMKWDITKLPNYHSGRHSSWPFSETVTSLMSALIR